MTKKELKDLGRRLEMHGYKKEPYFLSETSFVYRKQILKGAAFSLSLRFQTWDHSEFRTENPCTAEAVAIVGYKGEYNIKTEIETREKLDIEEIEKFAFEILDIYKKNFKEV